MKTLFSPQGGRLRQVLLYIKKVKSRHGIGIPTTCGYRHYGNKKVLMLELRLLNITLHYHYDTTYCIIFLHGNFTIYLFPFTGTRYSTDQKL